MSVIRHSRPVATGNPGEQFWDVGTGAQVIDMSVYATGAPLYWSVAGQGASINPNTGLLSVLTNAQAIGARAVVTAKYRDGKELPIDFTFHIEDLAAGPGPDLARPTLDDVIKTIGLTVDEDCTIYWRRDPSATNPDPVEVIAGGGNDSGSFAVTAGANTANITFAIGNDGPQEISFAAAVVANEPSLVRTEPIDIDTTAPALSASVPAAGATGVANGSNPVLTFSKPISAGTGTVSLYDVTAAALEVFDVVANAGTGVGQVEIAGTNLRIRPTLPLADGRDYAVLIDPGALRDIAGNDFDGITSIVTLGFSTGSAAVIDTDFDAKFPVGEGSWAGPLRARTFPQFVQFNVIVGATIPTMDQTSVTYGGVTFTFDQAMPVGFFVTGEPFVVSDQAFAITSITPASSDLQGDGHVGHGAMKNPFLMGREPQGFDGYLGNYPPKTTYETDYDAAVNVDPAVNGSLAVAAGERASIVKSIRNPSVTSPTGDLQRIEKYVILTVLGAAPALGAYRPGMAGTTKRIRTRIDVDFTPRGLLLPGSFPSVAAMLSTIPSNIAPLTSNGERRRHFRLDKALGTTNDNYSAEVTPYYARLVYALNASNTSPAQAQEIIDHIITFANDLEAVIESGGKLGAGAGQGGGMWLWLMAAAALTRDDALLQTCHAANLQPTANGFWVTPAMVGQAASGKSGVSAQTYFPEHIGIPHVEPDEAGSHHGARYLNLAADIGGWEQAAILNFNQGPAGKADGRAMILNGASNDASNQLAATHNFLSRWYRFFPSVKSSGGPSGDWKDAWDQLLAAGAVTGWTGPPDQPPKGNSNILDNSYFTAGDGQITLTDQNLNYATETITRRDMRWSLDGVQWIEQNDVGALPFTKTGLLKSAQHWCGWRRHSASGVSPWSANFPYATPIDDSDHAERVTTSGSAASAAPVNTVAPMIHTRPYPAWAYPLWSPAPATLGANDIELAAGVGYWSGFPAPTFSFQWKRDGATISGATDATYARTAADADAVLSCDVTATNASDPAMVTTAGVTCPALAVVPQSTLIDTDFRGAFTVDYEAELAAITTSDSIARHEPTQSHDGLAGVNLGAIRCDKTGPTPHLNLPFRNAAVAGRSYTVTAQIATSWQSGSPAGFAGQCILEIRNAATVFLSATLDPVVNTQRELLDISDSFAVPGGETDLVLFARIRNTARAGRTGQGDPMLHRLIVNEI